MATGCNSNRLAILHAKDRAMPTGPMKKISIGRADLMVPEDATVTMTGEVNEVKLQAASLGPGEEFAKLWNDRLKLIESGAGVSPGHTVIRKNYPATNSRGQVYFEQSKDPVVLVVMERWQVVGTTLMKAKEEFEPKYLADVEKDFDKVFANLSVGGTAGPGDFAVGPVLVHLPPDGGESTDASIKFNLPGKPGQEPTPMSLDFNTELLTGAGSITILNRIKKTSEGSEAVGVKVETLRARKRSIGDLPGEESALSFASMTEHEEAVRAEWGSPGVANDASRPQTEMLYDTEGITGQQPHTDVALALRYWDGISESLRFRR